LIEDLFNTAVDIYRLQGFTGYDFSGSSEGEVTEDWGIIALGVPARLEPEDTPFRRAADGIADTGTHDFYVGPNVDIQNGDRAYRAVGEAGPDFFEVTAVVYRRDFKDQLHHREIKCTHIDWVAPLVATEYIPGVGGSPNTLTRITRFNYNDTFPKLSTTVLGDSWIEKISVQIVDPFDDPNSTFSMGYGGSQNNLISIGTVDMGIMGDTEAIENVYFLNSDSATMYVDPGSSTQGSGIIFVTMVMGS
jgi:hypothetical protein